MMDPDIEEVLLEEARERYYDAKAEREGAERKGA
jgi:hypothetical protein